MAEPFDLLTAGDGDHRRGCEAWGRIPLAVGAVLGVEIDRACLDPSRLYYLPRHANGAPWEVSVFGGDLLDATTLDLPPSRAPAVTASTPASPVQGAAVGQALAMQWPVRGDILRRFGPVGMGERNNGINIGASAGAEVKAAAAGRVAYVGDDLVGQGLTVLIVHRDGWRTVYGHLGSATVRDGAEVRAGQAIGTVGLTAGDGRPSIHFETRQMRGDDSVAVDPLTVLPR